MKIGLYFGSFNPIHNGHLIIANHLLNETDLEKIWFIVSPQNPLKATNALLNEYDRLHLVRLAVEDDIRMKASDIEFGLPKPSYTINTLTYLSEKYPADEFAVILGGDSLQNIRNWKNYEAILSGYKVYVYKRPGFAADTLGYKNVVVMDAPVLEISATRIRELVKAGKSIRYMVPEKVREEIEASRYFRN